MNATSEFRPNDVVLYGSMGLGTIVDITEETVGGETCRYYHIHIPERGTVLTPVSKTNLPDGVRLPHITDTELTAVIEYIEKDNISLRMDAGVMRKYQKRFASAKPKELARVIRDLRHVNPSTKGFELHVQASRLLVGIVAATRNIPIETTLIAINDRIKDPAKHLRLDGRPASDGSMR